MILLYDISDPENLQHIKTIPASDYSLYVYVEGKYAYISDVYDGMVVYDVSDLSNPVLIKTYSPQTLESPGYCAKFGEDFIGVSAMRLNTVHIMININIYCFLIKFNTIDS